jgi:hypothetical protein
MQAIVGDVVAGLPASLPFSAKFLHSLSGEYADNVLKLESRE